MTMTIVWHTMPLLLTRLCGTRWLEIRYLIEAKRLSLFSVRCEAPIFVGDTVVELRSHNILKSFCMRTADLVYRPLPSLTSADTPHPLSLLWTGYEPKVSDVSVWNFIGLSRYYPRQCRCIINGRVSNRISSRLRPSKDEGLKLRSEQGRYRQRSRLGVGTSHRCCIPNGRNTDS